MLNVTLFISCAGDADNLRDVAAPSRNRDA